MAQTILDFVKNPEILSYARQLRPESFFGLELFPVKTVDELDYEYIKGVGGSKASIIANVVNWESAAPMAPHEGIDRVEGELPPIKQKSRFSEKEVIKIFSPRTTSERNAVITRLYDDVAARVDGIFSRLNLIIMESLATGAVVFASEGIKMTVDWGVPGGHKATPSIRWSEVATAIPLTDMQVLQATIRTDSGYTCDRAITSTSVINYLLQNTSIKQAIFGTGETSHILTLPALNGFLASVGLPTLFPYDEQYKEVAANGTISSKRYYNEKQYTMFSSAAQLGETLFGPTAEALRGVGAEEAPGVFAEVFETKDPVNVWTYAVATAFPTFPGADSIGIVNAVA